MQIEDRRRGVKPLGTGLADIGLSDGGLGVDVRDGQALSRGKLAVGGKVVRDCLLDFQWARVLPLDAIGVVGVHSAQQVAQARRDRQAGQPGDRSR